MQIESVAGCANAEAVAAIEGVDCLMVGNADLRLELGLPAGLDGPEESYNQCLKQITDAGKKFGKPVLTFTGGPGSVEKKLRQGFSAFMVGSDGFGIGVQMRQTLNESWKDVQKWKEEGSKLDL